MTETQPRKVRMPDPDEDDRTGFDVFADDGTFSTGKSAAIYEQARSWPADQKAALLRWLRSTEARAKLKTRYRDAAQLAQSVDPGFVVTPALQHIATSIERVLASPRRNLLVTMPPQEGKSSLCAVWTPIRALQLNPNRRIILATYGDALAETHSASARDIITRNGTDVTDPVTGVTVEDKIGLKLSTRTNKVSAWKVEGGNGGVVAVGMGSSITGRPADLFIIDDPYKNMMEADSASHRRKVDEWFASVVLTRLSPQASIILIQTRWHPEDLSGKVIDGETALSKAEKSWRHINIPAISEEGIPDVLGRPPGVPMESVRDGVDETGQPVKRDFPRTRRDVGERVWYALYQGSPRIPSGGMFLRKWFEPRLEAPPIMPVASIVGIDPADSGEGDETGIIGGVLDQDGTVVLTEDWSGQMTSDEWGRQAVLLALTMGAREIAMEAYAAATTYTAVLKRSYRDIRREAYEKHTAGAALTPAEQRALTHDVPPFTIYQWRAKGDAVGRSALMRQAFETRKCRTVEYKLGVFESQACDWQAGQHQPDRVAAALIAHDRLAALGGGRMTMAAPVSTRPQQAPAWMRRRITA